MTIKESKNNDVSSASFTFGSGKDNLDAERVAMCFEYFCASADLETGAISDNKSFENIPSAECCKKFFSSGTNLGIKQDLLNFLNLDCKNLCAEVVYNFVCIIHKLKPNDCFYKVYGEQVLRNICKMFLTTSSPLDELLTLPMWRVLELESYLDSYFIDSSACKGSHQTGETEVLQKDVDHFEGPVNLQLKHSFSDSKDLDTSSYVAENCPIMAETANSDSTEDNDLNFTNKFLYSYLEKRTKSGYSGSQISELKKLISKKGPKNHATEGDANNTNAQELIFSVLPEFKTLVKFVFKLSGAKNVNAVFSQYETLYSCVESKGASVEELICGLKNADGSDTVWDNEILIKAPRNAFANGAKNKRKGLLKVLNSFEVKGVDMQDCEITSKLDAEETELLFNRSIETFVMPYKVKYAKWLFISLQKGNEFKCVKKLVLKLFGSYTGSCCNVIFRIILKQLPCLEYLGLMLDEWHDICIERLLECSEFQKLQDKLKHLSINVMCAWVDEFESFLELIHVSTNLESLDVNINGDLEQPFFDVLLEKEERLKVLKIRSIGVEKGTDISVLAKMKALTEICFAESDVSNKTLENEMLSIIAASPIKTKIRAITSVDDDILDFGIDKRLHRCNTNPRANFVQTFIYGFKDISAFENLEELDIRIKGNGDWVYPFTEKAFFPRLKRLKVRFEGAYDGEVYRSLITDIAMCSNMEQLELAYSFERGVKYIWEAVKILEDKAVWKTQIEDFSMSYLFKGHNYEHCLLDEEEKRACQEVSGLLSSLLAECSSLCRLHLQMPWTRMDILEAIKKEKEKQNPGNMLADGSGSNKIKAGLHRELLPEKAIIGIKMHTDYFSNHGEPIPENVNEFFYSFLVCKYKFCLPADSVAVYNKAKQKVYIPYRTFKDVKQEMYYIYNLLCGAENMCKSGDVGITFGYGSLELLLWLIREDLVTEGVLEAECIISEEDQAVRNAILKVGSKLEDLKKKNVEIFLACHQTNNFKLSQKSELFRNLWDKFNKALKNLKLTSNFVRSLPNLPSNIEDVEIKHEPSTYEMTIDKIIERWGDFFLTDSAWEPIVRVKDVITRKELLFVM